MTQGGATPERLLADLDWLRGLARRLVSDPHLAEDAVQETVIAALSRSEPRAGARRGWLAKVLRNAVRQEVRGRSRRREREARAAAPAQPGSPASIAEQLELQRRLVEWLLALEEPYRTTLVRHFLHGRSAREIAVEQALPVKTVHTRLERGLGRLRERLDREHGGARAAWIALLLPVAHPPTPTLSLSHAPLVLTMNAKSVVGLLGVIALGTLLATQRLQSSRASVPPAAHDTADLQVAPERSEAAAGPAVRTLDSRRVERATPAGRRESAPPAAPARLQGSVLDLEGHPVPGVEVVFEDEGHEGSRATGGESTSLTGPRGTFELPLPHGRGRLSVRSLAWACVSRPYLQGILPEPTPVIVVAPSRDYSGVVVDASGSPVARARVVVSLGRLLESSALKDGLEERTIHLPSTLAEQTTDAEGRFALLGLGFVPDALLIAQRDGHGEARSPLPPESRADLELVLAAPRAEGRWLHGLVLDEHGRPVSDALASLGGDSVHSNPEGRFALALDPGVPTGPVMALKAGHLPGAASFEWTPGGPGSTPEYAVVVVLGGEPRTIRGRVVGPDGAPRSGVLVWTPETTFFGRALYAGDRGSLLGESTAERLVAGRAQGGPWELDVRTTSTEDGAFELRGLLDREYTLFALDPVTLAAAGPVRAPAGDADVRLRLADSGARQRVAGRVVSADGIPLEGVRIAPGRRLAWTPTAGPGTGWERSSLPAPRAEHTFLERVTTSDAEGRFALEPLCLEGTFLHLTGPSILLADLVPLEDFDALEALEIVVEASARFVVVLVDRGEADSFGRVDEGGQVLPLFVPVEDSTISAPDVEILEGRSGLVRIQGASAILELRRGGRPVRQVEVKLDPNALQELRL